MRKVSLFVILSALMFTIHAQDDVILTVGNEKISKSEFERVYLKNNKPNTPDRKSINDYLDLYVNFRLKVLEAKSKGLDTLESFTNELAGYRDQLAKPYMNDTTVLEKYIQEAYNRMKTEISSSLILVKCDPFASPQDSMKAYQRIMKLRDRIVKKGEPFDSVAIKASDDQYAKYNGGYYGYSVAFRYAYPLETVVYNTKIKEVSMPVRTKWGYFIAKVNGTRPARGDVKVAHIMVLVPQGSSEKTADSAKTRIYEVYDLLKKGGNFEELVKKYSDDRYSTAQGGQLPMFHTGQMVESFEDSAFALVKPGDISRPCRTQYGWHIIKLIEKKPLGSYAEQRKTIRDYILRDERANAPTEALVNRIKSQYGVKVDRSKLTPFFTLIDSTIYRNDWNYEKAEKLTAPILTIGKKIYTQYDFALYVADAKNRQTITNIEIMTNESFKKFINDKILEFYKEQLPSLDQNFKNILNEYYDGILLFNITDQLVWSKAIRDTIGLQAFYETVKQKYMWKERIKADIYTCKDKKTAEMVKKILSKDKEFALTRNQIAAKVCPADSTHKCISLKSGIFEKGENKMLDEQVWKAGVSNVIQKDTSYIVIAKKSFLPSEPKKLTEARGFIIADYQSYLEDKWIKELRNKYAVVVNKDALNQLAEKYKK